MTAAPIGPVADTDITVNVEGLWMLQALMDIRLLAPELRARPFVSPGSTGWLGEHPGMAILREAGMVVDDAVRGDIAERLRVLAAPDLDVVMMLSAGAFRWTFDDTDGDAIGPRDVPSNQFRVVLARRGAHWVSAVRVGADITIDDVRIAGVDSIAALLTSALDSIHVAAPASITGVNVPLDEMLSATQEWQGAEFNTFSGGALRAMGMSAAAVATLSQALTDPAAEAVLYARQYRDEQKAASQSVLNLKDGEAGRIALYRMARTMGSQQDWMAISPATPQIILVGVQTVLETLPFARWQTHRRV